MFIHIVCGCIGWFLPGDFHHPARAGGEKKMKIKLVRDEGWYSESEMRTELKWPPYDT